MPTPSRQLRVPAKRKLRRRRKRSMLLFAVIGLFEPALTFGTVDPERIQFGNLMQKSFLRGDRNDHSAVAQKNGLTKLKIPIAQRQTLPFERGQGEIGPFEEIQHDFRVG
jgi:hypothetical protein